MTGFRDVFRHAFRSLARSPGFSALTILIFALALGAVLGLFALVDAVLLEPLPYPEPGRLVAVWDAVPADGRDKFRVSSANFVRWREADTGFEAMALYGAASAVLTGAGDPLQLSGSVVTEGFFPLLGVEAAAGRTFVPGDFEPDAAPVVLLSHALWRGRFGGEAEVVGRTVTLEGEPYTVAGVLPRRLLPLTAWSSGRLEMAAGKEHFWLPKVPDWNRHSHLYGVLARLAPGVTLEQAAERMDLLARRLGEETPDTNAGYRVTLVPLIEEAVGDVETALWVLLGAVGLLLVIAWVNLTNLVLVRAAGRRRELALHAALGASRRQILARFAAEAGILVAAGSALGGALASGLTRLLPRVSPQDIPRLDQAALDGRVWGVALALAAATALLFTLVPALGAGRRDLEADLAGADRISPGRRWAGRLLVAAEMALAVLLVVGSALLIKSFGRLANVDPGFTAGEVLTFELQHPQARYPEMHQLTGFYDRLFERLGALPGVTGVAAAYDHPLAANWFDGFRLEGSTAEDDEREGALFRTVTPGYFETLGIELVAGRPFTAVDDATAAGAVIVNQSFVRRFLGGVKPLGRRMEASTTPWLWGDAIPSRFTIVGVVEDVRFAGQAAPSQPAYYVPYAQTPHRRMTVFLRADREAAALLPEVRARLRRLDPQMPLAEVATLDQLLGRSVAKPRFSAAALGAFAGVSLLLALIGLAGVLGATLRQRYREIGIRMALGAGRERIFGWVLRHGLLPAVAGLVVGMAGALAFARLLGGLLYEVSPADPATYAGVGIALLGVSVLTCLRPAFRAARADPREVLRSP